MGVFDSVMVPCPECGLKEEFQSKGSEDRCCRTFELKDAPLDVLSDVNRHAPYKCSNCGTWFQVAITLTSDNVCVVEVDPEKAKLV